MLMPIRLLLIRLEGWFIPSLDTLRWPLSVAIIPGDVLGRSLGMLIIACMRRVSSGVQTLIVSFFLFAHNSEYVLKSNSVASCVQFISAINDIFCIPSPLPCVDELRDEPARKPSSVEGHLSLPLAPIDETGFIFQ
jgi:hypothetical protein